MKPMVAMGLLKELLSTKKQLRTVQEQLLMTERKVADLRADNEKLKKGRTT